MYCRSVLFIFIGITFRGQLHRDILELSHIQFIDLLPDNVSIEIPLT